VEKHVAKKFWLQLKFKKLHEVNNRPISENSPILVTLLAAAPLQ
jgi:hypothetical protein